MNVKPGQKAPDFQLSNQDGNIVQLSDFQGQWLLIYFYPKDDTPGCTKEACSMRDHRSVFKKNKINVLGISVDSEQSHLKFRAKYDLNFDLLADTKKEVVKKYGVWGKKKFMGKEYDGTRRQSALIDPQGKIAQIYEKVKPDLHAEEVLNDVKQKINDA